MAKEHVPGLVSVVVVNYNGKGLLEECLESLERQTYPEFETIVVDNGSTDGSFHCVKNTGAKLVRLESNRGFAGGNLEGLKSAKGEFVAVLNNDAVADENWLAEMVNALRGAPEAGICASRIELAGTDGVMDSAGDGCTSAGYGLKLGHGRSSRDFMTAGPVFGACGAAALYRRSMIDEIGFFDESFFLLFEDTDLNFRAQLSGYGCVYAPNALVRHRFRATIGRMSELDVYYSSRNSELVWLKNMPAALMLRYLHHKLFQEAINIFKFLFVVRRPVSLIAGKISAYRMLPDILRRRRALQKGRKAELRHIASLLTPVFDRGLLREKLRNIMSREN